MGYAVGYNNGKYYFGTVKEVEDVVSSSMVKITNIYANGSTSIRYFETIQLMNVYIDSQKKILRNEGKFVNLG